jgi:hypothetical protein
VLFKTTLVVFNTAAIYDVEMTRAIISAGYGREANPALRWIADKPGLLAITKGIVYGGVDLILARLRSGQRERGVPILKDPTFWTLVGLTAVQVGVDVHNYGVYQAGRRARE